MNKLNNIEDNFIKQYLAIENSDGEFELTKNGQNVLMYNYVEALELIEKINTAFYTRTSKKEWIELMAKTKPMLEICKREVNNNDT